MACLAVTAWAVAMPPAHAAEVTRERFNELLTGFYDAAMWADNTQPVMLRKWTGPLKVRLRGSMADNLGPGAIEHLRHLAEIAGLAVEILPAEGGGVENVLIIFESTSSYIVNGRAAGCYTQTRYDSKGVLLRAEVHINIETVFRSGDCAAHELMHAFGFPGHPHRFRTVLSYIHRFRVPTDEDEIILRLLYDPNLKPGLNHLPALVQARPLLAAQLGLDDGPVTEGRLSFERALQALQAEAENETVDAKVRTWVQVQLGNAYWFGHYVRADKALALPYWRKAADAGSSDAKYRLGAAHAEGGGVAADTATAADYFRQAAEKGHTGAALRYGRQLRDGDGIPANAGEAWYWIAVAARLGNRQAATERDRLGNTLDPARLRTLVDRVNAFQAAR